MRNCSSPMLACAGLVLLATGAAGPAWSASGVVAGKVTLFGVTLNAPLNLPDCNTGKRRGPVAGPVTARCKAGPFDGAYFDLHIPRAERPAYVASFRVLVLEGTVAEMQVQTAGAETSRLAYQDLVRHWGAPKEADTLQRVSGQGNLGDYLTAQWQLANKGGEIIFQDVSVTGRRGNISVLTPRGSRYAPPDLKR